MARSFASASSQYLSGSLSRGLPCTIACWYYPTQTTTNQTMFSLSTSGGSNRFQVGWVPTLNRVQCDAIEVAAGTATISVTPANLINKWNFIAGVFSSTTSRTVYSDSSSGTNTDSVASATPNTAVVASRIQGGAFGGYFDGRIAVPCVWNVALSVGEIDMLRSGHHPSLVRPESIIGLWDLDRGDSPEISFWGGPSLTLNGSPTLVDDPPIIFPDSSVTWVDESASPPSITATLSGPSSGDVGAASTNFTVALSGNYTGTITPASTGSGTFSPSSLTWSGTSESKTFTYTPASSASSPHSISISGSPAVTTSGSPVAYTVVNAVSINDASLFFSPYNWIANGATDASTQCPGAYLKIRFTGTSLAIRLNSPAFTGTSLRMRCIVDGDQTYNTTIGSGTTSVTLASGLASATHDAALFLDATDPSQDVWTNSPPTMSLRITKMVIDAGSSLSSVASASKRMLVYGDSLSYGIYALRTASSPSGNAAIFSPFVAVANALDCEFGILGFGSQGYGKTGLGNAPRVWDGTSTGSWDKYRSGSSRLSAGLYSPQPDYVFCYHGTADYTGSSIDADIQAGVEGLLPAIRGAAPSAKIFVVCPPGRNKITPILAGFESYNTSYTTKADNGEVVVYRGADDLDSYFIDLGTALSVGLNDNTAGETFPAIDGYHPDTGANGRIAAAIVSGVQLALATGGGVRLPNVRGGADQ